VRLSAVDVLAATLILVWLVGSIAPRLALHGNVASRRNVALVYGTALAVLLLASELRLLGLAISLAPAAFAIYVLRKSNAKSIAGLEHPQVAMVSATNDVTMPRGANDAPSETLRLSAPKPSFADRPPGWGAQRNTNRADAEHNDAARWISPGAAARVEMLGLSIPGGMIYFGSGLPAVREWGGDEPALVDPRLDVYQGPHSIPDLGYWPSYGTISPAARGVYLGWLSNGRRDPSIDIGYVFLFFYGLERRLLHDRVIFEKDEEHQAIVFEIKALLDVYGGNRSFHNYVNRLLSLDRLMTSPADPTRKDEPPPELLEGRDTDPIDLRRRLGELADARRPIPPGWALAWSLHDPSIHLRTPARRCMSEFQRLFRDTYSRVFGEGMVIEPVAAPLEVTYSPASASFGGSITIPRQPMVPDVASMAGPVARLRKIVEQCATELEPYSRWVGRNPDRPTDLSGLALLPGELLDPKSEPELDRLTSWLGKQLADAPVASISASELIDLWTPDKPDTLGKPECIGLCSMLDKLSFGLEPDVRFGGPKLERDMSAAVFRHPAAGTSTPSASYRGATILLHLATLVAAADDSISPVEKERLEGHLENALGFSEDERARMRAHLRWLLETNPSMAGLKRRLEALPPDHRRSFAEFLIIVAGADGSISPEEIDVLRRVYPALGFEPDDVYGHIHALAAVGEVQSIPAVGPVTVRPAAPSPGGRRIPRPDEVSAKPISAGEAIRLDQARIQRKLVETAAVAALLGSVFTDDEPAPAVPQPADAAQSTSQASIRCLDAAHSSFLSALGERPSWSRVEVETLAEGLGLLPDGAIEVINEAAFDNVGEAVVEGEDPLELNQAVWKELVA
jgi:tellurite resistance protein